MYRQYGQRNNDNDNKTVLSLRACRADKHCSLVAGIRLNVAGLLWHSFNCFMPVCFGDHALHDASCVIP
jgi:hypothetical protein